MTSPENSPPGMNGSAGFSCYQSRQVMDMHVKPSFIELNGILRVRRGKLHLYCTGPRTSYSSDWCHCVPVTLN